MARKSSLAALLLASLAFGAPGLAQDSGVSTADWLSQAEAAMTAQRYVEARERLEPEAARGNPDAERLLADLYAAGLGLPQNFSRALELYRRAAEQGNPAAANALGRAYAEGRAVEQDGELALTYLAQAARTGNPDYQIDLARGFESGLGGAAQPGLAAQWYQSAAEQGSITAMTSLGVLYLEGRGVARDPGRAIELFSQASEAGDARAQNNLGLLYVRGEDVERDYDRAFSLFEAAAAQGLREGITNLSVMYDNGFGVPVDEDMARDLLEQAHGPGGDALTSLLQSLGFPYDPRLAVPDWSLAAEPAEEIAAQALDPVALYQTGFRAITGAGVPQDIPGGIERMERAARAGLGGAQLDMAVLYALGRGVPQDFSRAYFWAGLAAQRNLPGAARLRDALALEMSVDQLHGAQAAMLEFATSR